MVGSTVDKRSDFVVVADENIASVRLKGAVRQLSSPAEVVENFLQAVVGAGNVAVSRNGPGDARSQDLGKGGAGPAGVELVLRQVQTVEQLDGGASVHWWRR
jgi:hypothetical protein